MVFFFTKITNFKYFSIHCPRFYHDPDALINANEHEQAITNCLKIGVIFNVFGQLGGAPKFSSGWCNLQQSLQALMEIKLSKVGNRGEKRVLTNLCAFYVRNYTCGGKVFDDAL